MKELSTEEKAKAYDEALERARKLKENPKAIFFEEENIHVSDYIFPELIESEDEKIREVLIELVKCNERSGYKLLNNVPTSSMIAWLEKQKPVEFCEEDEKIRKAISIYLDWLDGRKDCAPRGEYSIRDMVVWLKKQGEQKTDWSEEDERNLKKAVWYVENPAPHVVKDIMLSEWLKSLKDRYA